jgi:hypothetical protein
MISRNNTSYQDFINKTFADFKIKKVDEDTSDYCYKQDSEMAELASYQIFPSKLINDETDNRGILLYYKTGAGKTATFINIAEGMNREVIVISPASLRNNFIDELKKWTRKYSTMEEIQKKYKFISFDAPNILSQYDRIALYDTGEIPPAMNRMFKRLNRNKFDDKLIIIDECHEFFQHVVSTSKQCEILLQHMQVAKNCKFVFATATPIIKNPFELVPMFNILAGFEIFPSDVLQFEKLFVDRKNNRIRNQSVFMDRINGLVYYYAGLKDEKQDIIPKDYPLEVVTVPMSEYQYKRYMERRVKEWDEERRARYAVKEFEKRRYKLEYRKGAMIYKTKSRQVCNFALPATIEDQIERELGPTVLDLDLNAAKRSMMDKLLTNEMIRENLGTYSPKIDSIIRKIKEIRNELGNIVVYSDRINSGVYIFARSLESTTDFVEMTKDNLKNESLHYKRYAIIDGRINSKTRNFIKDTFNRADNYDGKLVKILIGSSVIQRGLSFLSATHMFIMNALWKHSDIVQAKGRINRICSHKYFKDKKNRFTKTYLYLSAIPEKYKKDTGVDNGLSSEQIIHNRAIETQIMIETFHSAMEMASIDCELNRENNDINCRICKPTNQPLFDENPSIDTIVNHVLTGSNCEPIDTSYIKLYEIEVNGDKESYRVDLDLNIYRKVDNHYEQVGYIDPFTNEMKITN